VPPPFNTQDINMKTAALFALAITAATFAAPASAAANRIFKMVQSSITCQTGATGRVTVAPHGPAENMHVEIAGLPANTSFDFFILQAPKAPFGISWYQGDIKTDANGLGVGDFVGRFNVETFNVAPGATAAPSVHAGDAGTNPATAPIHMYHLGVWFNSPADAVKAGCPGTVTPFNGEHNAGVQVLNTATFPNLAGPLKSIE